MRGTGGRSGFIQNGVHFRTATGGATASFFTSSGFGCFCLMSFILLGSVARFFGGMEIVILGVVGWAVWAVQICRDGGRMNIVS